MNIGSRPATAHNDNQQLLVYASLRVCPDRQVINLGDRVLNCFLVEDSPVIRHNLIATLEEMLPLRVVGTAEDEAGAMRWLEESDTSCDLLIIDVFLRTGTGLEVLRRAKALRPKAKFVVLTNYATREMRQRAQELGADRLFDKSGELEDLLAYCEALTETRDTRQ